MPKRLKPRFTRTHTPTEQSLESFSADPAIAFFTSWSNSFTEIFSRAVIRLFELWCMLHAHGELDRERLHLLPAMWGSDWGPDYARYWLSPFSTLPVEPMAATPPRELVKLIWRAQASAEQWKRYANLSATKFASRTGPRCYQKAFVCDFTGMPWGHTLHPWSSVQMIAAHHGGERQLANTRRVGIPRMRACSRRGGGGGGGKGGGGGHAAAEAATADAAAVAPEGRLLSSSSSSSSAPSAGRACPLHIVFADRKGRRKLSNIKELVELCSQWRPSTVPSPLSHLSTPVNCTMHNFGEGLIASLPTLWRADVLVVSHGADVINGFAMHAGASIIEVMPVHQAGCPCDMYRRMYTYQGPTVLHYQMVSTNDSRAVLAYAA